MRPSRRVAAFTPFAVAGLIVLAGCHDDDGVRLSDAVAHLAADAPRVAAPVTATVASAAQSGPAHVQTWAYYDSDHNAKADPSYMLRHVDWTENTGDWSLTDAFRSAGGAHAVQYIDPQTIYYCNAPFGPPGSSTPGSCALPSGPLEDPTLSSDESAWLHGAHAANGSAPGARLHSARANGRFLYEEALYAHSPHVRAAYHARTAKIVGEHPIDAIFMDDSAGYYSRVEFEYSFGTSPAEYERQADPFRAYTADLVAMACAAARPVFFNGPSWNVLDPKDGPQQRADDTAMLRSPCVAGIILEGAFMSSGNHFRNALNQPSLGSTFIPKADQALLPPSLHKSAVIIDYLSCSYGDRACRYDPLGDRIYSLAATWLVYDPRYTIAFSFISTEQDPKMVRAAGGRSYADSLVAELDIVPAQPLQTASNVDITTLQFPNGHTREGAPRGGTFRREFAQCYQNGASIGHCAAVVNAESNEYTSGGVAPMPPLSLKYTKSLVLNDAPADTTGTATWTGSVPSSLQPASAVILRQ